MLRRMLAITLLIAFGSPLVAPLFAATTDPQASLPACCRRHGAHHCTMLMPADSGSAFQAPPCPFFPTATTQLRVAAASLTIPLRLSVEQFRNPAPPVATERHARTFAASANLNRGPPVRLA